VQHIVEFIIEQSEVDRAESACEVTFQQSVKAASPLIEYATKDGILFSVPVLNRIRDGNTSRRTTVLANERRVLIVITVTIGNARGRVRRRAFRGSNLRENGDGNGDGVHEGATIATISDSNSLREGVASGVTRGAGYRG